MLSWENQGGCRRMALPALAGMGRENCADAPKVVYLPKPNLPHSFEGGESSPGPLGHRGIGL